MANRNPTQPETTPTRADVSTVASRSTASSAAAATSTVPTAALVSPIAYQQHLAQQKIRDQEELQNRRPDETMPGGFFLASDKKTAHDSFGRPLDPSTGEVQQEENVTYDPRTGAVIRPGTPITSALVGTPAHIDSERAAFSDRLASQESREADSRPEITELPPLAQEAARRAQR